MRLKSSFFSLFASSCVGACMSSPLPQTPDIPTLGHPNLTHDNVHDTIEEIFQHILLRRDIATIMTYEADLIGGLTRPGEQQACEAAHKELKDFVPQQIYGPAAGLNQLIASGVQDVLEGESPYPCPSAEAYKELNIKAFEGPSRASDIRSLDEVPTLRPVPTRKPALLFRVVGPSAD